MVFQDPHSSLDPRMTVGESVAEAIPRDGEPPGVRRPNGSWISSSCPRAARGRTRHSCPAGSVSVSRSRGALAGKPDVIIADEITSALDVSTQGMVLNVVRDLQRRMRLSTLFISHNLAVVRYVSDIIAVMYQGRIVECGPADDVLTNLRHQYTGELLAAAPRPGSTLADVV